MWAQDYDEKGEYIKTWVPELRQIPAPSVFEPWRLSREDQQRYGTQIGVRGLSCRAKMQFGDLLQSHDTDGMGLCTLPTRCWSVSMCTDNLHKAT